MELLIRVDEADRDLGTIEKMAAHESPVLHRAVSGFAFTADGGLLLQRRALGKYHCGGLIANTCCSHPRPGETALACVTRRAREELGLTTRWRPFGTFRYQAALPGGLWECELVHLFVATAVLPLRVEAREVAEILLAQPEALDAYATAPDCAPWLRLYTEQGIVARAFDAWRDDAG